MNFVIYFVFSANYSRTSFVKVSNMKNLITIFFLIISLSINAQSFPDSETDGKYYEVNGAKLWIVSFGTGDPIFFIAGGPGGTHYGLRSFDSLSTINPTAI